MRSSLFALSLASALPVAWAGRGNSTSAQPIECPFLPSNPQNDTASVSIMNRGAKSTGSEKPVRVSGSTAKRRQTTRLAPRAGTVTFDQTCDNQAPPDDSVYSAAGFTTMTDVLRAAYRDAVTLATAAQNVPVDNKGFSHYFGEKTPLTPERQQNLNSQHEHFQNMMAAVASNQNHYSINFVCADPAEECKKKASLMATDPDPAGPNDVRNIIVCDLFWTGSSTQYLLDDQATPSPPYRDYTEDGWCGKREDIDGTPLGFSKLDVRFFATAGNTVLHELTHLDALAAAAGLLGDPADGNRHGTGDFQKQCELSGARKFLVEYKKEKPGRTSPDYNAESYAAAATEIYFMDRCDFTEIWPTVK